MTDRWFYAENGHTAGPETLESLLSIFLRRSDWQQIFVWRDGFDEWRRADVVPEISSQIRMPPPPPQEACASYTTIPPPIPDELATPVGLKPKTQYGRFYTFISFCVVSVVVLLAYAIGGSIAREASKIATGSPRTEAQAVDEGLTKAENEVRPTLPKKVDDITTLVAISHNGYRMRYELVVDVGSDNKLSSEEFLPLAKKEIAKKVCASAMKKSLEMGVSYEYTYRGPNHSPLGSFVVVNSDCR